MERLVDEPLAEERERPERPARFATSRPVMGSAGAVELVVDLPAQLPHLLGVHAFHEKVHTASTHSGEISLPGMRVSRAVYKKLMVVIACCLCTGIARTAVLISN